MSFLSTLGSWAVKRRRLLAGVMGVAVETAAAAVPGVNIAAKFLGDIVEKATTNVLDPDTQQPLPAEQLSQINTWLESLSHSYSDLLDRLEHLPIPDVGPLDQVTLLVKQTLASNADLAQQFDVCLVEVRKQTLSLSLMERKLDEHFHAQQQMRASLEELKDLFIRSPMAADWAAFRAARPDAVQAVALADEHFLSGRRDEGVAVLLGLLRQRGVSETAIAHQLGLLELSQGRITQARQRLKSVGDTMPAPLVGTMTRLSTLSGRGGSLPVWRSLPRGFRVGRKYRIVEEIGRGGMASVYRAERTAAFEKERVVALKVPSATLMTDPTTRQRFEQEIEVSRRLSQGDHDHIVRILDYEIFDDPYTGQELYALVMEHVEGTTLASFLARRREVNDPLRLTEIRNVMAGVCAALEHAHAHGVLHRDLKPHNVMVARGPVIKLMDFGIARVLDESRDSLTRTGQAPGTLAYMPPEMLAHSSEADVRTDVYMAGVLLLELLTFDPAGDPEKRGDCPGEWLDLIADSMNRIRARRPADIATFRSRLEDKHRVPEPTAPKPVPARESSKLLTTLRPLPKDMENSLRMWMKLIPAGQFYMGSPETEAQRHEDEGPRHLVQLTRPFYISAFPVTVAQFEEFVRATGYKTRAEREGGGHRWIAQKWQRDPALNWRNPDFPQERSHPVVCISWDDAQAFVHWLSELSREKNAGRVYRLPTEAEWEHACRGDSEQYQPFHVGDFLSPKQANFDGNHPYGGAAKGVFLQRTTAVGTYGGNSFGLYDLHGNVWEWCADWFESEAYQKTPPQGARRDPQGATSGTQRVLRGGSWGFGAQVCRSAYRFAQGPEMRGNDMGMRVVCEVGG